MKTSGFRAGVNSVLDKNKPPQEEGASKAKKTGQNPVGILEELKLPGNQKRCGKGKIVLKCLNRLVGMRGIIPALPLSPGEV